MALLAAGSLDLQKEPKILLCCTAVRLLNSFFLPHLSCPSQPTEGCTPWNLLWTRRNSRLLPQGRDPGSTPPRTQSFRSQHGFHRSSGFCLAKRIPLSNLMNCKTHRAWCCSSRHRRSDKMQKSEFTSTKKPIPEFGAQDTFILGSFIQHGWRARGLEIKGEPRTEAEILGPVCFPCSFQISMASGGESSVRVNKNLTASPKNLKLEGRGGHFKSFLGSVCPVHGKRPRTCGHATCYAPGVGMPTST